MIAVAVERHLDRLLVERPVEGLRIEVARAFVEEARDQRAQARLAGRVLRRAPAHREFERDERHRVRPDEPEFQAARSDDDFDIDGGIGGRNDEVLLHERFHDFVLLASSAAGERGRSAELGGYAASLVSGRRCPVTAGL